MWFAITKNSLLSSLLYLSEKIFYSVYGNYFSTFCTSFCYKWTLLYLHKVTELIIISDNILLLKSEIIIKI